MLPQADIPQRGRDVLLQSKCCASADALTVAGLVDCRRDTAALATGGRPMVTVSAIVFVPVVTKVSDRTATAAAFRRACHAAQQRECSQAWPVGSVPYGRSVS